MKQHLLALGLLILISIWAVKPLFSSGFFPMHDDTQVGRVVAMGQALRNGQFPVRWVSELGYGYGYPLFNFYGPLPYYFGGLIFAIGISGLLATKLMILAGIVLPAISLYFLANSTFGILGGMLAGIFYLYAPYHAVQIYVRGAIGEAWTLIFLPLILLGLKQTTEHKSWSLLVGATGLAGAILSHTLLGYAITLFLFIGLILYLLFNLAQRKSIGSALQWFVPVIVFGLSLSAFFWLPAIFEMRFTSVTREIGMTANFRDHFVCPEQLWNSLWGFGGSIPGCIDGLSFKLGKLHLILSIAALIIWFWKRRQFPQTNSMLAAAMISGMAIFLTISPSQFLWEAVPLFAYLQYPWRFLTLAIFGLSFLIGAWVLILRPKILQIAILIILSGAAVVLNEHLFKPQYLYERPVVDFEKEMELRWQVSKISDEYLPPQIIRPKTAPEVVHDTIPATVGLTSENEVETETYAKYILQTDTSQRLTFRRAYFPGWQAWVNGQKVSPIIRDGLMSLNLPAGRSVVEFHFTNTPVRWIGNWISLFAIIYLLLKYGKKNIT